MIIKRADKGSGTVVMDMGRYENECLRQLSDTQFYEKIDKALTPLTHKYVYGLQSDTMINNETAKYLKENTPKPADASTLSRKYTKKATLEVL